MLRLGELGETDICVWVSGARMLRLGELGRLISVNGFQVQGC